MTSSLVLASSANCLGQAKAPVKTQLELTAAERKAIANCLTIIRGCQLPDGSFNMVNEGRSDGSPVWVAPYFVQHAAVALLAANDFSKNAADVARVGKWLDWCASHVEKDGYWYDYTGTVARHTSNGKVDAHDSSAAMFLLAASRYQRSGGQLTAAMITAAKSSYRCICKLLDSDGLSWAKTDYRVKYLMDNVEVCSGLIAAKNLLTATGDSDDATTAAQHASKSLKALQRFYGAVEKEQFAVALHPSGTWDGGLNHIYPEGLAQLFGVAFVAPEPVPFAETCKAFQPQATRDGVGPERFLLAASRLGQADTAAWRLKVVEDAQSFLPTSVYIFRPALVVLSLLEGAAWMGIE